MHKRLTILFCILVLMPSVTVASELRIAATTTIESSGLLAVLKPTFEKSTGIALTVYNVGTGNAIRMGRNGEADLLITHAPEAENQFIQDGYGSLRIPILQNEFVLVGPAEDPAKVNGLNDIREALKRIYHSQSLFYSRADDSGTHKKELSFWQLTELIPQGDWYFEYGGSMGQTLKEADFNQAYVLVDRGTWLTNRSNMSSVIHIMNDPLLVNIYSILKVNPNTFPNNNHENAERFIQWITGDEGKQLINTLAVDGEQLFRILEQ